MIRTRIFIRLLAAVCLLVSTLHAGGLDLARDRFNIDGAHSLVGFSAEFMGVTRVEGRFKSYRGTILFNEKDPTQSSVTVLIRTNSIDTANDFRDRHLKSQDFFDAEKHPTILFRSTRVEKQGGGYVLVGPLTMRGVTKEVRIPFQIVHGRVKDGWQNTRVGFLGKLQVDRRDFGIYAGEKSFWEQVLDDSRLSISHQIDITLNIQARISNFERISGGPKWVGTPMLAAYEEKGIEAALAVHDELKKTKADQYDWNEFGLNALAYRLLYRGKAADALRLFQLNVQQFPESANVYDSLADGYAFAGDAARAIENYKKSLAMDANNSNAMEMLRYLGAE